MAKTRSMTRNQNLNASSKKMIKTCDKGVVSHWSDLNHDVLLLVMMRLGVIEFVSFSGVCKSWRSLTLSNRNNFLESRPPMLIWISTEANEKEKDCYCYLEDSEGRRFKSILPHSAGRTCYGITFGYLILSGKETNDFWLVNLITRHELHFPCVPHKAQVYPFSEIAAILVFSPSISEWVFVISNGPDLDRNIWFSRAGKGAWNHVSSTFPVVDLHAFKGKIYGLNYNHFPWEELVLYEMRVGPQPILTLLETKNLPKGHTFWGFLSSGENLYLIEHVSKDLYKVHELDFSQMKWMLHKKTNDESTIFLSSFMRGADIKPESWDNPLSQYSQYSRYVDTDKSGYGRSFTANTWYFPNDCLNVNRQHE